LPRRCNRPKVGADAGRCPGAVAHLQRLTSPDRLRPGGPEARVALQVILLQAVDARSSAGVPRGIHSHPHATAERVAQMSLEAANRILMPDRFAGVVTV